MVNNWRQLQQVAGRLRQEIISATVPPHWVRTIFQAARQWQRSSLILRPSLAISTNQEMKNISGLLESVYCPCEEEEIGKALKLLWSQLFRARSLIYWRSVGISLPQINLGVLVQPVNNAIASGILNTKSSAWDIEATWGLGLAITNGEVLPDVYYIEPKTGVVIERQLGNKMFAYRLCDQQLQPTLDTNFLLAYLLEESQQQEYALPEEYLQELITLGNQVVGELGTNLTMKSTVSQESWLTQISQFQLWIMAEVPSVLFLLPEYIKAGVAGISIGTNDLTQLLLGIDREQGKLGTIFDEIHPAVMAAIAQLIKMAQSGGIPCSICGQAPVLYPEIIDQLIAWGITSISVEPEAVDRTYKAIARAEQRLILAAARKQFIDL